MTDPLPNPPTWKPSGAPDFCPVAVAGDPLEVASKLRELPGFFFLDTVVADGPDACGSDKASISIIGACPERVVRGNGELQALATAFYGDLDEAPGRFDADIGLPRGGLFGWVDYDGAWVFGAYPRVLVFHHPSGGWWGDPSLAQRCATPAVRGDRGGVAEAGSRTPIQFQPEMAKAEFLEMVQTAQEYIASGDIYQVNLSQRFAAEWEEGRDAFQFYCQLRAASPAPYSAFFDLAGRQVLSSSPELFLRMSGTSVTTRPIKGTRPRFRDRERDERSAYDLLTSPKEIAELVMITDLERNDLGQVCEYGSVTVDELLKLERFAQVFHLVSTVSGVIREGVDQSEVLTRCFPGGSITGAPKRRAMQIINELEPVPRGLYTGSVGYFGTNGESQFNIAIRTVVAEGDTISFHVGAGIVADSDPELEFEETLHKAEGILEAARLQRGVVGRIR